jgi:signal transduction histidine kinase
VRKALAVTSRHPAVSRHIAVVRYTAAVRAAVRRDVVGLVCGMALAMVGGLAAFVWPYPVAPWVLATASLVLAATAFDARRVLGEAWATADAEKRRALDRLAGEMAQRVTAEVTVIATQAERLTGREAASDAARSAAGAILTACRTLDALSASLAASSGRQMLAPSAFDVTDALRAHLAALEGAPAVDAPPAHDWPLAVTLSPHPLPVELDRDQFLACIDHLLANARLAAGTTPIDLRTDLIDGMAVVSVRDGGAGMSPERLLQATEPYFSTWQRTGLGLSVVQGFATRSGGFLARRSRPGRGTTAALHLPLADPGISPRSLRPQSGFAADSRILVVDDQTAPRAALAALLRTAGALVEEAHDAAEARTLLGPRTDAVIIDIVLPGDMDGFTLGHWIRAHDPLLPLVFTSGVMSTAQPGRLAQDDLTAFVRKPIVADQLIPVLAGLLAVRDARRSGIRRR